MRRYTAEELEKRPTLSTAQADDLKIDTGKVRVWLSRCGTEDGAEFENMVSVERLVDGRWELEETYEG